MKKIIQNSIHAFRLRKLPKSKNQQLGIVIFSKDRPIQLYALLESYAELCEDVNQLTVLYKCSRSKYQVAYNELKKEWPEVVFIEERSFKNELINTISKMDVGRILFLVDDIIFTRKFSTSCFNKYDLTLNVPSLRLGKNIVCSYTRQQHLKQPNFASSNGYIQWEWIRKNSYWSYPLSLDGHIFDVSEIKYLFSQIEFVAPNSLEESLYTFNKLFSKRKGVAFEKSVLVNIPWNLVQTEINNLHGDLTAESMLKYWQENQKIDIAFFRDIDNDSCHKEYEINLISRGLQNK